MSGNLLNPDNSPTGWRQPAAGRGVRRLNRVPLMIVFGVCAVIVVAIIYTFHQRIQNEQARDAAESTTVPQAGSPNDALAHAPKAGLISPPPPPSSTASQPQPLQQTQNRQPNPIEQDELRAWTNYEQRKEAVEQAHYQAEVTAIGATPDVRGTEPGNNMQMAQPGGSAPAAPAPTPNPTTDPSAGTAGTTFNTATTVSADTAPATLNTTQPGPPEGAAGTTFIPSLGLLGGGAIGIPPANPNANDQAGKQAFLAQPGSSANTDYLQARITTPMSPYEIRAGSVIPATMIGGINSDLPSQIIAQVRENVYDTATGKYLLIPQGSRLVGVYSSAVTYGQTRVLVAWNRIIYPNGDSFDLGQMPGADQAGYGGFNDEVDHHYIRIFGSALLASLFSAGAQLSQPQNNTNSTITSTQILAAALGQQANTVGSMLIARGLDIQPTLKIRNGFLFNIMVTKDLILQPWNGMQPLPYGAPGRN